MENRCVCCGKIVPEGRQVCPACDKCAHVWVYDGLCKDDGKAYFTYRCRKCGMYREAESIERK